MEKFYPNTENIGKDCMYWCYQEGCQYPKIELLGRRSCEGIIDDVCLFVNGSGPRPTELTENSANAIKSHPSFRGNNLPPGNIR